MAKAVKITEANHTRLITQYNLDDDALVGKEGLYLIADFGESTPVLGYLTRDELLLIYRVVGKLRNDYFEIKKIQHVVNPNA